MRARILFVLTAIALAGCQQTLAAHDATGDLTYFRDPRTGLCFAELASVVYGGFRSVSIANVPCDAAFPTRKG